MTYAQGRMVSAGNGRQRLLRHDEFDWTEARVARMKELHAAGLSTRLIAADLGCTKSAVVGKSHREGCKPRPSPIKRKATK